MKRYKIVNRFRFITFITVCILVICFATVGIFGLIKADAANKESYTEVEVISGDTIWELAKTYGNPQKDIRRVVYDICSINNITADTLMPGQIILIPEN